ncbi:FixH family protein [Alkalihalobacillus sp. FSL R5-0424]
MKKGLLAFSIVALFMIASCAIGQNQSDQQGPGSLDTLEAEIHAPSETALDEPVMLQVNVTYGGEPVTDATLVTFEIWENGHRDAGETITAEESEPGVYSLETTFNEDGIYHIQSFVEAGNEQIEPTVRIIAGDVSETELEAAEQEFQQEEDQEKAQESDSK